MRDLTFWETKRRAAEKRLQSLEPVLKDLERFLAYAEGSCALMHRGAFRQSRRLKITRAHQNRAHLARQVAKLRKKISFYNERIAVRQNRTVWDVLRCPEV